MEDRASAEKFYAILEEAFPHSLVVGPEMDRLLEANGLSTNPERIATYLHHIRHKMEKVVFTVSSGRKVYAYLLGTPKGIRVPASQQTIIKVEYTPPRVSS